MCVRNLPTFAPSALRRAWGLHPPSRVGTRNRAALLRVVAPPALLHAAYWPPQMTATEPGRPAGPARWSPLGGSVYASGFRTRSTSRQVRGRVGTHGHTIPGAHPRVPATGSCRQECSWRVRLFCWRDTRRDRQIPSARKVDDPKTSIDPQRVPIDSLADITVRKEQHRSGDIGRGQKPMLGSPIKDLFATRGRSAVL